LVELAGATYEGTGAVVEGVAVRGDVLQADVEVRPAHARVVHRLLRDGAAGAEQQDQACGGTDHGKLLVSTEPRHCTDRPGWRPARSGTWRNGLFSDPRQSRTAARPRTPPRPPHAT